MKYKAAIAGTALLFAPSIAPGALAVDPGMGRQATLCSAQSWEPTTSALTAPSPGASFHADSRGTTFTIPEPGREMTWQQSLRPAWLDYHRYMTLGYRASGLLPSTTSPLVRLRVGADTWITVLKAADIQADGTRHERTVDIRPLTTAQQVSGVQIHVLAGSDPATTLVVDQLDFTDQLPGFAFPPPTPAPPATSGYDLDVSTTAGWSAMPAWVGNAATDHTLTATGTSLKFSVADSSKGMKWLKTPLGNLDITAYPYVAMRYRCRNMRASASDYALWLNGNVQSRPFYLAGLTDDGGWHWAVAPAGLASVNQMAVQVQSDTSGDAWLEVSALRFMDRDPRTDLTYFAPVTEGWGSLAGGTAGFQMLDLTQLFNTDADQLLPRMALNVPWFAGEEVVGDGQIPFRVRTANPNLAATDLPGTTGILVPVGQSACEVYLLLATWLPGREISFSSQVIAVVDETERFGAEVLYADGSREEYFPLEISSGMHVIGNPSLSVLAFPANPSCAIETVLLHDRTDGGMFAVAALTLNTSGVPFFASEFAVPPPIPVVRAADPASRTPTADFTSPSLVLDGTYARWVFDLSQGLALSEWQSRFTDHQLLGGSHDGRLFSGNVDGTPFTSLDFVPTAVQMQTSGATTWTTIPMTLRDVGGIEAALSIRFDGTSETQFALALANTGGTSRALEMLFPDLPGITLGNDPATLWYAYPYQAFILSNSPITVENAYSGRFPMQFIDLYDSAAGWGASLLVKDTSLITKYFGLKKSADEAGLWVRYATLPGTGLPAGEQMELAPFTLAMHAGDWHDALEVYRAWVSGWYAVQSPRQQWFQDIYTCRRDYPISGSGALFDRTLNTYTFDRELDDAERCLGGADLVDISNWGWSATYGRVGEYRRYEPGGLANFRAGVDRAGQRGVPTGLYIEGYLIDNRCTAYAAHGDEWTMRDPSGNEMFYSGSAHEVILCPWVTGWQEHMRQLYSDVIQETGAAAMYIDQFGYATPTFHLCHSTVHGHLPGQSPLRGELEMTRAIREGLNAVRPGIPLYTEYTPVDVISQYQDGSFSYTIYYGDPAICPTETNLFRFCFPTFKQIELVNGGFNAMNWTEEGLKKAFLNGEGLWIKGDLASWYDARTIAFYRKSHEIFRDHCDAFRTPSPEPFVPALAGNVYANRFADGAKQVCTFYNANWRTVSGDLVRTFVASDAHVVDLWSDRMVDGVGADAEVEITGELAPRDIGCIGIFPSRFEVLGTDDYVIDLATTTAPAGSVLEVVGINGTERRVVEIGAASSTSSLDLRSLFDPLPERVLIKIRLDGVVIDEIAVTDLPGSPGSSVSNWLRY